jgi:hypothetical protein
MARTPRDLLLLVVTILLTLLVYQSERLGADWAHLSRLGMAIHIVPIIFTLVATFLLIRASYELDKADAAKEDRKRQDENDAGDQKLIQILSRKIDRANDKRDAELVDVIQEQTRAIRQSLQRVEQWGRNKEY